MRTCIGVIVNVDSLQKTYIKHTEVIAVIDLKDQNA